MFIAVFTQSLSGFGVVLVVMALLLGFLDIRVATPLIALVALTMEVMLLNRYRSEVNWLGILAGIRLDHWIHPDTFRKMVLALLVIMGSRLLLA